MPALEEVRTITPDGRVVVPWVIQRALGLDHGGSVRFRVENGVVTLAAVAVRNPAAEPRTDGRTDIKRQLAQELQTLLAVSGQKPSDP
jgi:bifunctional DNA-binding transcriptional regulator/antitoxin component of YhaV-PrlF toxin-antitoxin module